jgi:hypothetical protein
MQTYITIYKNEKRAIQLHMNDNDNDNYQCNSAYASVVDSNGNNIRRERPCYTDDESAWDLIETDVTGTAGIYYIIWKILNTNEVIYHSTKLEVIEV